MDNYINDSSQHIIVIDGSCNSCIFLDRDKQECNLFYQTVKLDFNGYYPCERCTQVCTTDKCISIIGRSDFFKEIKKGE